MFRRSRKIIKKTIENELKLNTSGTSIDIEESVPQNFVRLVKSVLARGRQPVVIGVPVWWRSSGHFDAGWEFGPDVQMPSPVNLAIWLKNQNTSSPPNVDGWHAITICGYNDNTGRFEFKNSWGWWWGNNGFGTIPYNYITKYADLGMHGWL